MRGPVVGQDAVDAHADPDSDPQRVDASGRSCRPLDVEIPGGKPLGIYHLSVPRTSPDLLDRLMEYFEQKYDLMLMEQASA